MVIMILPLDGIPLLLRCDYDNYFNSFWIVTKRMQIVEYRLGLLKI
jgi:hypothetical protein